MRKLHNQKADSLDLLLDTLCNVFGGIILIACLLALLSQDRVTSSPIIVPVADAVGQLLEQRTLAAQAELKGLEELLAELDSGDDTRLRLLAAERDALKKTVERLRREVTEAEANALDVARRQSADPGAELARLQSRERQLRLNLVDLQAQLEAAWEKNQRLNSRLGDLAAEKTAEEGKRLVKLRLPKERLQTREPFPVIIRFGKVYPLTGVDGKPFDFIRPVDESAESFSVDPPRGGGFDLSRDTAALRQIFQRAHNANGYLTCYIYPDSFGAFRDLKSLMHDLALEYGVSLCTENEKLIFGSKGKSPNPL
ncbi:MAG TPA: hypothetical protein VD994_02575 [Prosthecobacter sp.]|nr:hypothetical protein [Prosthecobacter sp.]